MIECLPIGICAWNYRLTGATPDETARLTFDWLSEQGEIRTLGASYLVSKVGIFSGTWQLEREDEVVAVARKLNPFTRIFEIEFRGGIAVLEAESPFFRAMVLRMPDGEGGSIRPVHPLTRRATMEMAGVPFEIQCFAFWLTALMWRRAANSQ
jgi:hypothetical protein